MNERSQGLTKWKMTDEPTFSTMSGFERFESLKSNGSRIIRRRVLISLLFYLISAEKVTAILSQF